VQPITDQLIDGLHIGGDEGFDEFHGQGRVGVLIQDGRLYLPWQQLM
jgi:hypothetical protein